MRRWVVLLVGSSLACNADDTHRCGAGARDCLGGACVNGECTSWSLATSPDFPIAIVSDRDDVDWVTQSGDIFSVSKSGGDRRHVVRVASGLATGLATSSSSIFIAGIDGLTRFDRSTSELTMLDDASVLDVATNAIGDVYWPATRLVSTSSAVGVKRARGGTPELLAGEESAVIAVDLAGVYWIDGTFWNSECMLGSNDCEGSQFPVRARFVDGTFATYAAATPMAEDLAADGDALYVADWCMGTITRIEHADGTATVIARDLAWPVQIRVDDTFVYVLLTRRCSPGWFSTATGSYAIARVVKTGGPVSFLSTLGSPSAIAIDDDTVYYVATSKELDGGSREGIFAIAKP